MIQGTVHREGEVYYRVTCVGRSASSNQPKILAVEFNQSSVFVKELVWPPGYSAGLGSMASNSFIGSCTFSVPYPVGGTSSQGMIDNKTEVYERAFLAMLASTGSIFWFGEDCDPIAPRQRDLPKVKASNTFMFEEPSIINISEDDNLVFGGECAVKDPITTKKKLSLNNRSVCLCWCIVLQLIRCFGFSLIFSFLLARFQRIHDERLSRRIYANGKT